jgi:hypothetical protein
VRETANVETKKIAVAVLIDLFVLEMNQIVPYQKLKITRTSSKHLEIAWQSTAINLVKKKEVLRHRYDQA